MRVRFLLCQPGDSPVLVSEKCRLRGRPSQLRDTKSHVEVGIAAFSPFQRVDDRAFVWVDGTHDKDGQKL